MKSLWVKVLAGCYPALTVGVIVVTANHYFLDAIGGFIIFGIGYVTARIVTRAGRPRADDSGPGAGDRAPVPSVS